MNTNQEIYTAIQDKISNAIKQSNDGDIMVLDALLYLEEHKRYLQDTIAIISDFKNDNFDEIATASEEYKEGYKGCIIQVRSGGTILNFKNIPEWQEIEVSKKKIEARYKAMLDSKMKGNPFSNVSQEGEELPLPEITYRKSSLIIKPKK